VLCDDHFLNFNSCAVLHFCRSTWRWLESIYFAVRKCSVRR